MEATPFNNRYIINATEFTDRQQYTMNLLVANKPGVLGRIALVFSRRGYNIEALTVNLTLDRKFSRIEITTEGHEELLGDIIKQTRNIIDVIHVNLNKQTEPNPDQKQNFFYRINCPSSDKAVILGIVKDSNFSIVDFDNDSIIIQTTNTKDQNITFFEMIRHYGDVEEIFINASNQIGERS